MESSNLFTWNKRTYIQEQRIDSEGRNYLYGSPIYFDVNIDTSKNSTVDLSESPIDAREGATLSDKRIVNMKTIGISGKYSAVNTNNSSFKVVENRLGIIIDYFEDALNKQRIYTVCRKGSIYSNMMLNKVNLKFDEHYSTVTIALSFIEVIIIGVESELQNKIITSGEVYQDIINNFVSDEINTGTGGSGENPIIDNTDFSVPGVHKQIPPRIDYSWKLVVNSNGYNHLYLYVGITNFNPKIEGINYTNYNLGSKISYCLVECQFTYRTKNKNGETIEDSYEYTLQFRCEKENYATDFFSLNWFVRQSYMEIISPIKLTAWFREETIYLKEAFVEGYGNKRFTQEFYDNPSNYIIYLEESNKTILTIPIKNIPDLPNN